jgi:mono/diheme cytochrome c family protein
VEAASNVSIRDAGNCICTSETGQNCARCHGLDAESGGIAPDLRYLEVGDAGDEWYIQRFQHGSSHDGKVGHSRRSASERRSTDSGR